MARIFIVESREFPDPDPNMSVDDVRKSLTDFFPELANAMQEARAYCEHTRRAVWQLKRLMQGR